MIKKLNSMIIPDSVIEKMKENIDITRYKNIESGFNLCKLDGYIHEEYPCTGTSCEIIQKPMCQKGEFVGTFHTHTSQPIIEPSIMDMVSTYKYGISCIGSHSVIYNIDCFKRKGIINKKILDELKSQSIKETLPSLRSLIPTREVTLKRVELENFRKEAKKLFEIIPILRY